MSPHPSSPVLSCPKPSVPNQTDLQESLYCAVVTQALQSVFLLSWPILFVKYQLARQMLTGTSSCSCACCCSSSSCRCAAKASSLCDTQTTRNKQSGHNSTADADKGLLLLRMYAQGHGWMDGWDEYHAEGDTTGLISCGCRDERNGRESMRECVTNDGEPDAGKPEANRRLCRTALLQSQLTCVPTTTRMQLGGRGSLPD